MLDTLGLFFGWVWMLLLTAACALVVAFLAGFLPQRGSGAMFSDEDFKRGRRSQLLRWSRCLLVGAVAWLVLAVALRVVDSR